MGGIWIAIKTKVFNEAKQGRNTNMRVLAYIPREPPQSSRSWNEWRNKLNGQQKNAVPPGMEAVVVVWVS